MTTPIEFLDLDDVVDLARILLGDPPPIRDHALIDGNKRLGWLATAGFSPDQRRGSVSSLKRRCLRTRHQRGR